MIPKWLLTKHIPLNLLLLAQSHPLFSGKFQLFWAVPRSPAKRKQPFVGEMDTPPLHRQNHQLRNRIAGNHPEIHLLTFQKHQTLARIRREGGKVDFPFKKNAPTSGMAYSPPTSQRPKEPRNAPRSGASASAFGGWPRSRRCPCDPRAPPRRSRGTSRRKWGPPSKSGTSQELKGEKVAHGCGFPFLLSIFRIAPFGGGLNIPGSCRFGFRLNVRWMVAKSMSQHRLETQVSDSIPNVNTDQRCGFDHGFLDIWNGFRKHPP